MTFFCGVCGVPLTASPRLSSPLLSSALQRQKPKAKAKAKAKAKCVSQLPLGTYSKFQESKLLQHAPHAAPKLLALCLVSPGWNEVHHLIIISPSLPPSLPSFFSTYLPTYRTYIPLIARARPVDTYHHHFEHIATIFLARKTPTAAAPTD
ncbi:hypothetical protein LX32DRAFT_330579 [Colletotrichum zoysiae]|uniref:Uncharacterized protein n=1 Tax=Colletotrichum zoysiae TaxID=1216348 RepID=A0AAD9HL18_9PEZI|nr:hypothetical protein LX32DRAFT_330579 [Colletotrichum zoysiae]